jgi:pentatricopeptide repeat protein
METVWKLHDKLSHRDQWTYNQMVAVAAKGGFVKKAFSIYQKMKKIPLEPTLSTYHWLLQACANGKESDGQYLARALYVVEQMDAAKLKLNLHSYNLLLQICANANDLECAAEVLRKMSGDSIAADVSSLSSLLNCTRGGTLPQIQQVWDELKTKFTPDIRAWNTYINVLKDSKFHAEAIAAFKQLIETPLPNEMDPEAPPALAPPSAFTLSMILDLCGEIKDYNEARHLFIRIIQNKEWREKIQFDEVLFHSMIRIASRLKSNMVFAVEKLNEEKKHPISQSTRELYIMAYGRTSDLKGSLRHFEAARISGDLNLRCFTGFLIACRTTKDPDRAFLSFDVLRRCKIKPDEVYLKLLKEVFSTNGRMDLIKKLDEALLETPIQTTKGSKKVSTSQLPGISSQIESTTESENVSEQITKRTQHVVVEKKKANFRQEEEEEEVDEEEYQELKETKTPYPKRVTPRPQPIATRSYDMETPKASTFFPPMGSNEPTTTAKANVILPSNEPSAARSVFFASQRQPKFHPGGSGQL